MGRAPVDVSRCEGVGATSPPSSPLPAGKKPHPDAGAPQGPRAPLDLALPPPAATCCCCSLRSACVGIATLFVVVAVLSVVACSLRPAEHEFEDSNEVNVHVAYRLLLILAVLKVLLSIMLFIGILRERMEFIRPWLISYFVLCPVEGTVLLASAFIATIVGFWGIAVTFYIVSIIYIGLYSFCLYVLYCYYASLQDVIIVNV